MLEKLTKRQQEVMDFIVDFYEKKLFFPTFREIGAALGISSTNGVMDHIARLRKKGWLRDLSGTAPTRGLAPTIAAQKEYPVFNSRLEGKAISRIRNYILDFPENVKADLQKCKTPEEGALLVLDNIEDLLDWDY